MIVAERKQKIIMNKFDKFGEEMSDGRLTAPFDGIIYDECMCKSVRKEIDGSTRRLRQKEK